MGSQIWCSRFKEERPVSQLKSPENIARMRASIKQSPTPFARKHAAARKNSEADFAYWLHSYIIKVVQELPTID